MDAPNLDEITQRMADGTRLKAEAANDWVREELNEAEQPAVVCDSTSM